MAHPALLLGRRALEEGAAVVAEGELAAAELPGRRLLDAAAQLVDHQLHPVTDAQHRDPEVEELLAERRGAVGIDRGRAAGEHKALRPAFLDPLEWSVVREQLAEDSALTDATGDQLRVLAAEVEDEDLLGGLGRCGPLDLAELRLGAGNGSLGNMDPSLGVVGSGAGRFGHPRRRQPRQPWRARWSPCRPTARAGAACPRTSGPARPSPRRGGTRGCRRSRWLPSRCAMRPSG